MTDVKRYLITGGTGFIGTHLCRRLISGGHEVHVVVEPSRRDVVPGASPHVFDGDTGSLVSLVDEVRPDFVFHLASLYLPAHTTADVRTLIESNVLLGAQLLEAMSRADCRGLVNVGTGWQHFSGPEYDPVNLYAATKQAFEDIAAYYVTRGVSTSTLALYDTYGPDDPRPKVLPQLIDAALSGAPIDLSPGEQLLHLVHIDDIVAAFLTATDLLEQEPTPRLTRYSITAGPPLTLRELAAAVERVTGRTIDARWGARAYRNREVLVPWVGDVLPGWRPAISIDEGIRRMVAVERKS